MRIFRYGPHPAQFAELTLPPEPGPHPVAVVLHGGFWKRQYDLSLGRMLALDLTDAGVAVWNVEYRRVGHEGGGWPGTVDDVAAAVDLLAEAADALLVEGAGSVLDLSRVVAIGHSAGGHLATLLATRPGPVVVPVTGVVSQAGVLDLVAAARDRLGDDAAQRLSGGTPAEVPDTYAAASPIARLPVGVPISCVHGDRDRDVPATQSIDFVHRARAAGDRAELIMLEGVGHYEVITVGDPAWTTCRDEVLRLLG